MCECNGKTSVACVLSTFFRHFDKYRNELHSGFVDISSKQKYIWKIKKTKKKEFF